MGSDWGVVGEMCQLALLIVLGPVVASELESLGEGLPPGPLPSLVPTAGFILTYLLSKTSSFLGRVERPLRAFAEGAPEKGG